jgi:glycolate oxidase FAD binding subunit
MDLIHPHSKVDVIEALREASRERVRVLVVGGRHHIDRGNPTETDVELWTTQLDEVVVHEPAEMLVVVEAGMRCGDLAATLAAHGQEWPVDAPETATVGGVIAAGVSSPRRLRVGHVRDTVTEMELVTGDGRLIKSGARTVKNVTGYDVHRLLTGSLGTLGVIVQVALKVRPLPERSLTLVVERGGFEFAQDVHALVPGAACVTAGPDSTWVRLEGWAPEVEEMEAALRGSGAPVNAQPDDEAMASDAMTTVEAAVPPSRLGALVEGIARWRALVGVGIAWIDVDTPDALAAVRERAGRLGGIAPAIRGPGGLGDAPVPGIGIQRRLKHAFDPAGVLAPGRSWAGI